MALPPTPRSRRSLVWLPSALALLRFALCAALFHLHCYALQTSDEWQMDVVGDLPENPAKRQRTDSLSLDSDTLSPSVDTAFSTTADCACFDADLSRLDMEPLETPLSDMFYDDNFGNYDDYIGNHDDMLKML